MQYENNRDDSSDSETGLETNVNGPISISKLEPEIVHDFIELLITEGVSCINFDSDTCFKEFLIENKVLSILEPLDEADQRLLKLDSIFNTLHVESESDLNFIISFFLSSTSDNVKDKVNITAFNTTDATF
ncbi:hypothetical protein Ciccas_011954 [Cichlidogyrus casuarinus]|uniref:Uncharacterized protein n=1 Tax=Cichlidogyrus casuarinus TaxID=1844966 RepID=A0ABD2PPS7_9PLAT